SSMSSTSWVSGGILDLLPVDVGLAGNLLAGLRPQARAVVLGRRSSRQPEALHCFAGRPPRSPVERLAALAFLLALGGHRGLLSGSSGALVPMSTRAGPTGFGMALKPLIYAVSSVWSSF